MELLGQENFLKFLKHFSYIEFNNLSKYYYSLLHGGQKENVNFILNMSFLAFNG